MFQTHNSHLVFAGFTVQEKASGLQTGAEKLSDRMAQIGVEYFFSVMMVNYLLDT